MMPYSIHSMMNTEERERGARMAKGKPLGKKELRSYSRDVEKNSSVM